MTRTHIAHIEAGHRLPSREDARRLDTALDMGDALSSLPREDGTIADYFEPARHVKQQESVIREFTPHYVPGHPAKGAIRPCGTQSNVPTPVTPGTVAGTLSHG